MDMVRARVKDATCSKSFLKPCRQAWSFMSQIDSKNIKPREYAEFAQGYARDEISGRMKISDKTKYCIM
jgi:hypothetical protein